jgi:signal transduction histidine kinase
MNAVNGALMRIVAERRQTGPSQPNFARVRLRRYEVVVGVAFLAAIACFVASTAYIERSTGEVTQESRAISQGMLPRAMEVVDMRSDLRKVTRLVADAEGKAEADPRQTMSELLDHAEQAGSRYESMLGPGDQAIPWYRLRADLRAIRVPALAVWARPATGESTNDALATLYASLDRADISLAQIEFLQREQAKQASLRVDSARSRVVRSAYALDGLSVLVGGALAWPAIAMVRKRRRAIQSQVDELEAFALRAAHDLRSPLAPAMYALRQVAERTTGDDPLRRTIERGERSLHTIERIIAGLFAFAVAGAKPEPGASASLLETLEAVVGDHADAARDRKIDLRLQCSDHLHVTCAPGVLASIIGNLVGNAIKYMGNSDHPRVEIRAFAHLRSARIEVIDTGPGVKPGTETRIFEPYVRGQTVGSGIGLGLATVKRLVTAHGGAVGVQGSQRRGSTFWVELPLFEGGTHDR